jgi:hypothetical protein
MTCLRDKMASTGSPVLPWSSSTTRYSKRSGASSIRHRRCLADTRQRADETRKLVSRYRSQRWAQGGSRRSLRRHAASKRAASGLPPENSFEAVAREWYERNATGWAPSHAGKIIRRLELDVFPWIGSRPIDTIRTTELLALLKRVEDPGAIETKHRVQQNCGQVFRDAVATGGAASDPSRDLLLLARDRGRRDLASQGRGCSLRRAQR